MLELEQREALREVFTRLEGEVFLEVSRSPHSTQSEMLEMIEEIASLHPKLHCVRTEAETPVPQVSLRTSQGGAPSSSRVIFSGVPGGHEFTSLVLAILNADGKGRLPDEGTQARVRSLASNRRLRTFVSLECENCPEVVQALNLSAWIHGELQHEVIDGTLQPEEASRLGVQGVPAVFVGDRLVWSGRGTLADLLPVLEKELGKREGGEARPLDLGVVDVAVLGGGPAGASAAIYTVRKGLKTALIADQIGGQLRATQGIENMISMPYTEGPKLSAQLLAHLEAYPVRVLESRKVTALEVEGALGVPDSLKRIELDSGETLRARTVIVATGARWRHLGVPGEKEHIGRGVAFCAHCDGPFYKEKRVVVVGGGNSGVEAALDLSAIASEVTLLEAGTALRADPILVEKLKNRPNVRVRVGALTREVLAGEGKVSGIRLESRDTGAVEELSVDGVFVQIGLEPNSGFLKGLVELTPRGEVVIDDRGRTSVPGIYAAGDVTTVPYKQIVTALGEGAKVALTAFEDRMRQPASAAV